METPIYVHFYHPKIEIDFLYVVRNAIETCTIQELFSTLVSTYQTEIDSHNLDIKLSNDINSWRFSDSDGFKVSNSLPISDQLDDEKDLAIVPSLQIAQKSEKKKGTKSKRGTSSSSSSLSERKFDGPNDDKKGGKYAMIASRNLEEERFAEAIKHSLKSISYDERNCAALFILTILHLYLDKIDEAVEYASKLRRFYPRESPLFHYLHVQSLLLQNIPPSLQDGYNIIRSLTK